MELLTPIVAIIDEENYMEIAKQLVDEDTKHVVEMLNNSKLAYESILEAKKKLGLWFVCSINLFPPSRVLP